MLLITTAFALLLRTASAVFADEAFNIDYHYALLGEPQSSTTFFHRPNPESRASLLYTLSEQNVVGALNPRDGSIVWRHLLESKHTSNTSFLRAADGADIVVSGFEQSVTAWSAADGRLAWTRSVAELRDVRVLEAGNSKDTIALSGGDHPAVVRLDALTGAIKWEHKIDSSDAPHQIIASTTGLYVTLLHKTLLGYYKLKVVSLDLTTGQKLDEYTLSSESELTSADTVLVAGANTAAPVIAWTDGAYTTLKVNVLGNKNVASFSTRKGKTLKKVVLHAPSLANSDTHFLVHYQAEDNNWADVYHIDVKSSKIEKAYSLPAIQEPSAFSVSSNDASVYFTRISRSEVLTVSSASHGILGRWDNRIEEAPGLSLTDPEFAVTELSVRGDSVSAIRSAVWLTTGELVMHRDAHTMWRRPEALADIVKAEFKTSAAVDFKAFDSILTTASNPVAAFVQRLVGHLNQLKTLAISSLHTLGAPAGLFDLLQKDSSEEFGFHKDLHCTTRRGRTFRLTTGAAGDIKWDVLRHQTSVSESPDNLTAPDSVNATVRYAHVENSIKAYAVSNNAEMWTFVPKEGESILSIIARPEEDPVASIGVVLGNRRVLYKYLNPNLALISTANQAKQSIAVHIIDTISGSILYASTHNNVDLSQAVTSYLTENWFAYSFTAHSTDVKGHFLVSGELYESLSSNDRGLLEAASNFSSLTSNEKPFVLSQTYHISEPISKMAVTNTRQGITTKQLLVVLPESNSIVGIPRGILDPRRPNRDPTKEEQMEGLTRYQPNIDFDPRWSLNHKREILGIKDVVASPAVLESTSLIFAYGLDIFGTRLSPSFNFDMLGKDFNKGQMLSTVAALFVATVVVGPLVVRKQVNARWSLFT
ncbi:hypothetical protein AMS68_000274 [Peltaster fructicola]|uniref:ER membrane protein complex subunit 1 n=1 Tax=Peltaster fructicola TaxID=286661 RepID=A0A6H0XJ54_9PEZI|nr:hypothetical protein AMS68_000274 [Peltaster fructicola]